MRRWKWKLLWHHIASDLWCVSVCTSAVGLIEGLSDKAYQKVFARHPMDEPSSRRFDPFWKKAKARRLVYSVTLDFLPRSGIVNMKLAVVLLLAWNTALLLLFVAPESAAALDRRELRGFGVGGKKGRSPQNAGKGGKKGRMSLSFSIMNMDGDMGDGDMDMDGDMGDGDMDGDGMGGCVTSISLRYAVLACSSSTNTDPPFQCSPEIDSPLVPLMFRFFRSTGS